MTTIRSLTDRGDALIYDGFVYSKRPNQPSMGRVTTGGVYTKDHIEGVTFVLDDSGVVEGPNHRIWTPGEWGIARWLEANSEKGVLWTPRALDGLMLYCDDTSDYTDGTWENLKPSATWDLTQAASGSRPSRQTNQINGKSVLRFDGSDDFLTAETEMGKPTNYFIFAVAKVTKALSNNQSIFGSLAPTGENARGWGSMTTRNGNPGKAEWSYGDGSNFRSGRTNTAIIAINTWGLFGVKHTNGVQDESVFLAGVQYTNQGQQGSATAVAGTAYEWTIGRLGLARYCGMDFAAVVVTNTAIADADRQKVEGWAAHEYGLTAGLSLEHPYKDAPPGQSPLVAPSNGIARIWHEEAGTSPFRIFVNSTEVYVSSGNIDLENAVPVALAYDDELFVAAGSTPVRVAYLPDTYP